MLQHFKALGDAPISQTFMICVNDTTDTILKQFLANRFSVIRMAFDEIRLMNYVPLRNPKSTLSISTFALGSGDPNLQSAPR